MARTREMNRQGRQEERTDEVATKTRMPRNGQELNRQERQVVKWKVEMANDGVRGKELK
jgi:hypothetical protein